MQKPALNRETIQRLLRMQKDEITSQVTYARLAEYIKEPENREAIKRISKEESSHYNVLKNTPARMSARTGLRPTFSSGFPGSWVSLSELSCWRRARKAGRNLTVS